MEVFVSGVQTLTETGVTHVPSQYIQPPQNRPHQPTITSSSDSLNIPIIDLSNFNSQHSNDVRTELGRACSDWGAFQITNHGISNSLIKDMIDVGLTFFNECSITEKSKYSCDPNSAASEGYGSRMLVKEDSVLDWRDYFDHHTFPLSRRNPNRWPDFPTNYRGVVEEYSNQINELALKLISMISESLGLQSSCIEDIVGEVYQNITISYYPPCPQPELTLGLQSHSDIGAITLLIQDDVGGLEVLKDDKWVTVQPVSDAIVVILADQIEVFVSGVQTLTETGVTHVPSQYIQPPQNRPHQPTITSSSDSLNIPIIDLSNFNSQHSNDVRTELGRACSDWGAFQITNHGISNSLIKDMIDVGLTFFNECSITEKSKYSCDPNSAASEGYGSRMLVKEDSVLDWRDYFDHHTFPLSRRNPNRWPDFPTNYRGVVEEYSNQINELALKLISMISESLGLQSSCIEDIVGEVYQNITISYYPPCPQPELTLGLQSHSDIGAITLLIQDDVGGLEVLKDDKWVTVQPVSDAIVVILADQIEVFVSGVQTLTETGVTHVPSQYIQPPQNRPHQPTITSSSDSLNIPIIDLSNFNSQHSNDVRTELGRACSDWGAFQITNHGISNSLIKDMIDVGLTFFNECSITEKSKYSCDPNSAASEGYGSRMLVKEDSVLDWRDYFDHHTFPLSRRNPNRWPDFPTNYRGVVEEYSNQINELALKLISMISESLGLQSSCIEDIVGEVYQNITISYYPPCPQPELTLGLQSHSDIGAITLLIQDDVGGLEVLKDDKWVTVQPVSDAIVVILADQIEVFVSGVQTLTETGVTHVPSQYIQPPQNRPHQPTITSSSDSLNIPIIDLSNFNSQHSNDVRTELGRACSDWGAFQITNHGISNSLIKDMIDVGLTFFNECSITEKSKYSCDPNSAASEGYGSRMLVKEDSVLDWRDYFDHHTFPLSRRNPNRWPDFPTNYRGVVEEYSNQINELALKLISMISESLGLQSSCIEDIVGEVYQNITISYYPPCPQPELTLGLQSHSDIGAITLLIQDDVGGLEVLKDDKWVTVQPVSDAIVVILADQIEVFVSGVQTLTETGVTHVPSQYIQPPQNRPHQPTITSSSDSLNIPIIDLSNFNSQHSNDVRTELGRACSDWGAFQITNHGISNSLIKDMIDVGLTFFNECSITEKSKYSCDPNSAASEGYGSRMLVKEDSVLDWRDYFDHHTFPLSRRNPNRWPDFPTNYRGVVEEYSNQINELALKLISMISESLGLQSSCIEDIVGEVYQNITISYYPPCPQPELTLGLQSHSDIGAITLLIQDDVGGLEVLKDDKWVTVQPVSDAIVVILADQIEIMTNGKYRSAVHRAVTNSHRARLSVGTFHDPGKIRKIAPAAQLVDKDTLARYKEVVYGEYVSNWYSKGPEGKRNIDSLLLNQQ